MLVWDTQIIYSMVRHGPLLLDSSLKILSCLIYMR